MQLWGLDIPIVVLCWSIACAALLQITMITAGPMLLVTAGVWLGLMYSRLRSARNQEIAWQTRFYREHLAIIASLMLAVALAVAWVLCFHVGISLVSYLVLPMLLFFLSQFFSAARYTQIRLLLQGLALGTACATPAFYYSFTLSLIHMATTGPVWYLGILFYLLLGERHRLATGQAGTGGVVVNTLILLALLTVSLVSSATAPPFERTLCITISIGAGCLQGFLRMSAHTSTQNALRFSWLSLALPALLGIYLYAPHSW